MHTCIADKNYAKYQHYETHFINNCVHIIISRNHAYSEPGEPVWPSGKALGWKAEGFRFESTSVLLSLQKLWSVDTVLFVTLSLTVNETLKCFLSLPRSS